MDRRNLDDMRKEELMKYAKDVLGIETRHIGADGKKNRWRSVPEVRRECKDKEQEPMARNNDGAQSPHAPVGLPLKEGVQHAPVALPLLQDV